MRHLSRLDNKKPSSRIQNLSTTRNFLYFRLLTGSMVMRIVVLEFGLKSTLISFRGGYTVSTSFLRSLTRNQPLRISRVTTPHARLQRISGLGIIALIPRLYNSSILGKLRYVVSKILTIHRACEYGIARNCPRTVYGGLI